MQEWLNWLAWKASIPQKGIGGSNPPLSAEAMNASRAKGVAGSVLWNVPRKLAFEGHDLKTEIPPNGGAFMASAGLPIADHRRTQ